MTSLALFFFVNLVKGVVRDGRDPAHIPKIEVPEPPEWEDIEHPEFESYPIEEGLELLDNAVLEQFDGPADEILSRWKVSIATKDDGSEYTGEWALMEPEYLKGFNNDIGLVLVSENDIGAIARKFDNPIDTTTGTKPFVLQYEVKNQVRLRCGGGYVKLLPPTEEEDYAMFSGTTPYLIMFGPDKCGQTDKVHLILKRDGVEHHLVQPPRTVTSLLSTLYTLVIYPSLDFEVRINGAVHRQGNMLDTLEFDPPLVPNQDIPDANDVKPEDWDDQEYIPSPDETEKPDDWDEDEPRLIFDPDAEKPALWREDIDLFIPNPEASEPSSWSESEDGVWVPPKILNPLCQGLDEDIGEGCGEWNPPLIKNPKYKGKWTRPLVPNPNYQGVWTPRRVPNPNFDKEALKESLAKMDSDIGGIGIEVLTVQGMTFFDNIYIGNSVRDAENIGNATWVPKYVLEEQSFKLAIEAHKEHAAKLKQQAQESQDKPESRRTLRQVVDDYVSELKLLRNEPFSYSADIYNQFRDALVDDKIKALTKFPFTAVILVTMLTIFTSVFFELANCFKKRAFNKSHPVKKEKEPVEAVKKAVKNN